jgi:arsenite-transporting ATPase
MGAPLAEACGDSRFVFVVGKGGVGKTTTAGALAVAVTDAGVPARLISTDPAHSIGDLFGVRLESGEALAPCGGALVLEAFDARGYAERWTRRARPQLAEIMEEGTYLTAEDVRGVLDLSLPGLDELMAALRLAELSRSQARVIVDTAPTGHTLRLLDAGNAIEGWLEPLRAMATRAAIVATQISGVPLRLSGEALLDEIAGEAEQYRRAVLGEAAFLVVERTEPVVRAETDRLIAALGERGLRLAAVVAIGGGATRAGVPILALPAVRSDPADPCAELRRLARDARGAAAGAGGGVRADEPARESVPVTPASGVPQPAGPPPGRPPATIGKDSPARSFLAGFRPRILLFAGKGGVGKSTCAAAAALGLSAVRPVLLVGTDPAGSLGDVLGVPVGGAAAAVTERLQARQIDAGALLAALRARYREEIHDVFERIGMDEAAAVDRAVVESFWNLAPPGADEVMALIELTDALEEDGTLVVDASPTGHFLRLLEMPELVGQWTRALLRILARYRGPAALDEPTARVLAFARQLRELKATLSDRETTAVFLVTLDEPLVHTETDRLRGALDAAGTPVAACIVNRTAGTTPERWRVAAADAALFAAPERPAPPAGAAELGAFLDAWERLA